MLLLFSSSVSSSRSKASGSFRIFSPASSAEAVVNRDPKGERILELLQENKALRAKIARLEGHIDRVMADMAWERFILDGPLRFVASA